MGYIVKSEPCHVRTASGVVVLAEGATVPDDVDEASISRLLAAGVIGEAPKAKPPKTDA